MKITIKAAILASACVFQLCALEGSANATPIALVPTATIGGAATGSTLDNLDSNAASSADGITVSFTLGAGYALDASYVTGSSSGIYAAPYVSGSNNAGFEPSSPAGPDVTQYIQVSGTPGSTATLQFGQNLNSVGLLWGSIDDSNLLDLEENGVIVATVTGTAANLAASTVAGSQSSDGTAYVNITSPVAFNEIVASSGQNAFEFDNVSFTPAQVPEPLTLSLFGAGLAGAAALRRRKKAKKA